MQASGHSECCVTAPTGRAAGSVWRACVCFCFGEAARVPWEHRAGRGGATGRRACAARRRPAVRGGAAPRRRLGAVHRRCAAAPAARGTGRKGSRGGPCFLKARPCPTALRRDAGRLRSGPEFRRHQHAALVPEIVMHFFQIGHINMTGLLQFMGQEGVNSLSSPEPFVVGQASNRVGRKPLRNKRNTSAWSTWKDPAPGSGDCKS